MESNSEAPSAWDLQNFDGKKNGILKYVKPSCHEVENGSCGHGLEPNSSRENLRRNLFGTYEGVDSFSEENYSKEDDLVTLMKHKNSSPSPIVNLKLGTSADSETVSSGTSNASASVFPSFSSMPKRSKSWHRSTLTARCQVEGCNHDLLSAKDYHRQHKICENHSKSPMVIVAGLERRFCQQCSRFHSLS